MTDARIDELIAKLDGGTYGPVVQTLPGRSCARCGQWTPKADMMASTNATYGMGSYCLRCNVIIQKEWAQQNRERDRASSTLYYRRKVRNGGSLSDADVAWLMAQAGHRCLACREVDHLELDHIVPVSAGGSNGRHNRQVLCRRCNARKGSKSTDYRSA